MKTTLLPMFALICFSSFSQMNATIIDADYIVTTIEAEVENALLEIEQAQFELENMCLKLDAADENFQKAEQIGHKAKLELIKAKEKICVELLEVMENLDENEYHYEKLYKEKINEWNETNSALENLDIQPLK